MLLRHRHLRVVLVKGSPNRSNFPKKPAGGASFASDRAYMYTWTRAMEELYTDLFVLTAQVGGGGLT